MQSLSLSGEPGVGDAFLQWVFYNQEVPSLCQKIIITPLDANNSDFAEYPRGEIFHNFDHSDKKFVAVSCHYDILEWLQPDWVFDTNEMRCFFMIAHDPRKNSACENVIEASGRNLGVIII